MQFHRWFTRLMFEKDRVMQTIMTKGIEWRLHGQMTSSNTVIYYKVFLPDERLGKLSSNCIHELLYAGCQLSPSSWMVNLLTQKRLWPLGRGGWGAVATMTELFNIIVLLGSASFTPALTTMNSHTGFIRATAEAGGLTECLDAAWQEDFGLIPVLSQSDSSWPKESLLPFYEQLQDADLCKQQKRRSHSWINKQLTGHHLQKREWNSCQEKNQADLESV